MKPIAPSETTRIDSDRAWPLHLASSSQQIEQHALSQLPPHTLMQRAGRALAELALALAPHSQRIWIACGPGNNGGDGMEAAIHLHAWGKAVHLTWQGQQASMPSDARNAHARASAAGLTFQKDPPDQWDLAIDALLGLGCTRAPEGQMAHELARMHSHTAPVLQVDLASGLSADSGVWHRANHPLTAPRHTLSLLTLKPGLFTADGRDAAGEVWFNALGVTASQPADAWLQSSRPMAIPRLHNSHKGRYGDVIVAGGSPGTTGAALLAAQAALQGGAGRVFLALLDAAAGPALMTAQPALMLRDWEHLDTRQATVVCGCGGGDAVRHVMPRALSEAESLVLDADGLNALQDPSLMQLLVQRHRRQRRTVLTPHPLEAARLLGCDAQTVQSDRLLAAQQLANLTQAVVVLKGSGTVIASPNTPAVINPTGCAKLATAGSGDVLAGLVGAYLAQGLPAPEAACAATARHGLAADRWRTASFDAWQLAQQI